MQGWGSSIAYQIDEKAGNIRKYNQTAGAVVPVQGGLD